MTLPGSGDAAFFMQLFGKSGKQSLYYKAPSDSNFSAKIMEVEQSNTAQVALRDCRYSMSMVSSGQPCLKPVHPGNNFLVCLRAARDTLPWPQASGPAQSTF